MLGSPLLSSYTIEVAKHTYRTWTATGMIQESCYLLLTANEPIGTHFVSTPDKVILK